MELWIGGEIDSVVGDDFRKARNSLEDRINAFLSTRNYNLPFNGWDVICILRNDNEFDEIHKYSKKNNDMDFRLSVNYSTFLEGDALKKEKLIFDTLLRSLEILKDKGISEKELDVLKQDLLNEFS